MSNPFLFVVFAIDLVLIGIMIGTGNRWTHLGVAICTIVFLLTTPFIWWNIVLQSIIIIIQMCAFVLKSNETQTNEDETSELEAEAVQPQICGHCGQPRGPEKACSFCGAPQYSSKN